MNLKSMKVAHKTKFLACGMLAAALFCAQSALAADAPTTYKASPKGCKIRIDGDSTMHEWYMVGTMVGGTMELPAGVVIDPAKDTIPGIKDGKIDAKVTAIVPVRSVHSEVKIGSSIMDGIYQEHLKEKTSPRITYTLTEMKLKDGHAAGKPFAFDTTGELQIAGVTNKVSMPITIETAEAGAIKIVGSVPLKMTDYKIEPPAPNIGLGAMKCKDDVKVSFEWVLTPPAAVAAK